jgi:XTP/dITP diphosphohydrolase
MWTIADDSGLVVDALGGEPGVRSARYAGEPKNDAANNALLIRKLAGVSEERRTARFCCAVALAGWQTSSERRGSAPSVFSPAEDLAPGGDPQVLARAEGRVEGRIIDEPRGTNGFGYDPHFWVQEFGMTTAEMAPDRKHAISHRGQALRLLRDKLVEVVD